MAGPTGPPLQLMAVCSVACGGDDALFMSDLPEYHVLPYAHTYSVRRGSQRGKCGHNLADMNRSPPWSQVTGHSRLDGTTAFSSLLPTANL